MKIKNFLTEAQDYMSMFNDIPWQKLSTDRNDFYKKQIKDSIKKAKTLLKRNDRIVWYLRFEKAKIFFRIYRNTTGGYNLESMVNESSFMKRMIDKYGYADLIDQPQGWLENITHYLSLPISKIQTMVFGWQSINEVLGKFAEFEKEWQDENNSKISYRLDSFKKIVIDFGDGWVWVDLGRGACSEEAKAMGHCGNVPSAKTGDTILSLRKYSPDKKFWSPHLTFILHSDGSLGEMKGRNNDKPTEKYHKYIIRLLLSPIVTKIRGGGYEPQKNFSLSDLTEEEQEYILREKGEDFNNSLFNHPIYVALMSRWNNTNIETIAETFSDYSNERWNADVQSMSIISSRTYDILFSLEHNEFQNHKFIVDIYREQDIDEKTSLKLNQYLSMESLHGFLIYKLRNLYVSNPQVYAMLSDLMNDTQYTLDGIEKHVSPSEILDVLDNDTYSEKATKIIDLIGPIVPLEIINKLVEACIKNYRLRAGYLFKQGDEYCVALQETDVEYEFDWIFQDINDDIIMDNDRLENIFYQACDNILNYIDDDSGISDNVFFDLLGISDAKIESDYLKTKDVDKLVTEYFRKVNGL